MNFILTSIIWILAIYGLLEILKNIISVFTYSKVSNNGLYVIIATKNQEKCVESFLRSILFRIIYGKEEFINNLIVTDLNSRDCTYDIETKLSRDYEQIKFMEWSECKNFLDKINSQN